MQDSNKPDLEETLNVTRSHDMKLRDAAAVTREQHVDEGGREPLSLWVFGASAVIMLVAGFALGDAGSFFNYNETVKPGYVRANLGGGDDDGPPPIASLDAYMRKGKKIYSQCMGCHGADGKGSAAFPSLVGSEWALGDTERFAMIVLNGLTGPTSDGKTYGAAGMLPQGVGMTPTGLASVMTYVRNSFGNSTGDVVTVEMATEAMNISESREKAGQQVTAEELTAKHLKALPGEAVDPAMMVNPITLEPVE